MMNLIVGMDGIVRSIKYFPSDASSSPFYFGSPQLALKPFWLFLLDKLYPIFERSP